MSKITLTTKINKTQPEPKNHQVRHIIELLGEKQHGKPASEPGIQCIKLLCENKQTIRGSMSFKPEIYCYIRQNKAMEDTYALLLQQNQANQKRSYQQKPTASCTREDKLTRTEG